ncbi:MAG TPA: hypothetical protein VMK65_12655, partial [Longimicrobiales bacterium]|nr:hypothetical protein [Longimicrobiales bacterium]
MNDIVLEMDGSFEIPGTIEQMHRAGGCIEERDPSTGAAGEQARGLDLARALALAQTSPHFAAVGSLENLPDPH